MKNFFANLFSKKNELHYALTPYQAFSAYQPEDALYDQDESLDPMTAAARASEKKVDEMSIDNIYQSR